MTTDAKTPDPHWQLTCELWQALGRLVCAAANAEMWLRTCYYSLRPEADGPAVAEGETCDRLITMCKDVAERRPDLDPMERVAFIGALEDLRIVNKDRNRLFHDSWSVLYGGGAVQLQSLRKALPASRPVATADVVAVERAMGETISRVIASSFALDTFRDLEFYEAAGTARVRRYVPSSGAVASSESAQ